MVEYPFDSMEESIQAQLSSSRAQTPPPSKKRPLPVSPGSPQYSAEQMEHIVKRQTHASKVQLGSLHTSSLPDFTCIANGQLS
jgi:hypothetical protein